MSDTVKIALGIGAVAVVGYFLVRTTAAPVAVPRNTAPSNTAAAFISGIIPAFTSLINAGSRTPSAPANAPLANIGIPSADTTAYGTDPNYNPSQGDYGPYLPSSSLPA